MTVRLVRSCRDLPTVIKRQVTVARKASGRMRWGQAVQRRQVLVHDGNHVVHDNQHPLGIRAGRRLTGPDHRSQRLRGLPPASATAGRL